jgi:DNA-directed RNA polymerase specialized sigma subunit
MTRKEVVELIRAYGKSEQYINDINEEMTRLKSDIESMRELTAVTYSDMPKGSGTGDPTAQAAAYIIDVYEKRLKQLKERIEVILNKKMLTEELLGRLNANEYKVIEARYINGIKWDYIPGVVYLSRSNCFYCKKKAFEKMCK